VDFEIEIEDTEKTDTIIRQMRLTVAEEETLQYYLSGHGFVAIAKMQNVNNATVWKRRQRIQRKYLEYVK
jgi:DNA-binding CsgD family transcriptional regulator